MAHFGVCTEEELKTHVTAQDVNTALARHVHKVEQYVRRKVRHHRLTQAQFDGLVSFTYNVSNPSSVMEAADRGDMKAVYDKMLQYIYVFKHDAKGHKIGKPKILLPLYKRRLEEAAPFRQE
ncbi:glycoside hydrolase family protein [Erwinia sp. 198]|uniref:glycoside hydrolase family protein n=1 Tax=Erwinia sp. 198 TaxID=2022746 RepID=UPI003514BC0B